METLRKYYSQYHYFFPLTFLFLLPFGGSVHNLAFGLWMLSFLIAGNVPLQMKTAFQNKFLWLSLLFMSFYLIFYFTAHNKTDALNSIIRKSGFCFIPLFFFSHSYSLKSIFKIIIAYILGCILACMYCLLNALVLYLIKHENNFFYTDYSKFLHPSYAAMYYILALIFVIIYFPKYLLFNPHKNSIIILSFLVLSTNVFLCSSKMGIITYTLLIPTAIIFVLMKAKKVKLLVRLHIAIILIAILAYNLFPAPFARLTTAFNVTKSAGSIDKSSIESTAVRILIWKEATRILRAHPMIGVSPGDANDELYKAYEKSELTGAFEKKLNAHNEFLQIGVGLGAVGLITLLLIFVYSYIQAYQKKNIILSLFLILIIFNFLVESILQRQSGILFFLSFLSLFLHTDFKSNILSKSTTK